MILFLKNHISLTCTYIENEANKQQQQQQQKHQESDFGS